MIVDKSVRERLRELRKSRVEREGKAIPESIPLLEDKLPALTAPNDVDEVMAAIENEYAAAEMYPQQLEIARLRASNQPDNILILIGLARCLSYDSISGEHFQEAKITIERAVQLAIKRNMYVRYALTEKAWIAIRGNDSVFFKDAIEQLIQDAESQRKFEVDSRFFSEIADNISEGFCSPLLIERYLTAINRHANI